MVSARVCYVTFSPGEWSKAVVVKIIGGKVQAGAVDSEKVRIGDETAVGTLRNND